MSSNTLTQRYFRLSPDKICEDINQSEYETEANIEGIQLKILPHVYPSQKFRTTKFLLTNIANLVKNKTVCDMGCGPGIVGIFSIKVGAKYVVQADINPYAIENAKLNNKINNIKQSKIKAKLSDCFDKIPKQLFDVIIFNIPFHNDEITLKDPLEYAFFDPKFSSVTKFLSQAKKFSHMNSQIIIAFSNKGDYIALEKLFSEFDYSWKLWKTSNTDQEFDNRLYLLCQIPKEID